MEFTSWDLGHQPAGALVEVSLSGDGPNVLLLDRSNFNAYRNGRQYRYFGGLAKQSPVVLRVPTSDHWHVVIDYGGYAGRGTAEVRVVAA